MIDEILYQKHQNAITTSQHTEISVEYAIMVLRSIADSGLLSPSAWKIIKDKEKQLKVILK